MSLKNPVINWLTERSRNDLMAVREEFEALIPDDSEITEIDYYVGDVFVWGFMCPDAVMLYFEKGKLA